VCQLRGGDYILNSNFEAVTLSFCFYKDGKKYGLTVAHLCRSVGDPVYAFGSDTRHPDGSYDVVHLGSVVSMDAKTDSLVFEIRDNILIDSYCLSPEAGLQGALVIPDWNSLPPLEDGTTLGGFGAQRRGAVGVVIGTWKESTHRNNLPILDGDIMMVSESPGAGDKQLSDSGDCGNLFLDEH